MIKSVPRFLANLTKAITEADSVLSLPPEAYLELPSLGVGDYFYLTIENQGDIENVLVREIVASDVATNLLVTRGVDGTAPLEFPVCSLVEYRWNPAQVAEWACAGCFVKSSTLTTDPETKTIDLKKRFDSAQICGGSRFDVYGLLVECGTELDLTIPKPLSCEEATAAGCNTCPGATPATEDPNKYLTLASLKCYLSANKDAGLCTVTYSYENGVLTVNGNAGIVVQYGKRCYEVRGDGCEVGGGATESLGQITIAEGGSGTATIDISPASGGVSRCELMLSAAGCVIVRAGFSPTGYFGQVCPTEV